MSGTSKNGLYALTGSLMGLSTIAVGLRFYGRKHQQLKLGPDDWTALFGVITYIAASACGIEISVLGASGYGGKNMTAAEAARIAKPGLQFALSYDFLNLNTMACAKLSALFLYRRIFDVRRRDWFNYLIVATIAVLGAWYITFDVLSVFQCRNHFSAFWDGDFEEYCRDLNNVWALGLAYSDFLLDLWVLLLPVSRILPLHASNAKKLAIIGVFLLACVGLGASVARIVVFSMANGPGRLTLYIGLLESGMTILAVNLPTLWFFFTSKDPKAVVQDGQSLSSLPSQTHEAENDV